MGGSEYNVFAHAVGAGIEGLSKMAGTIAGGCVGACAGVVVGSGIGYKNYRDAKLLSERVSPALAEKHHNLNMEMIKLRAEQTQRPSPLNLKNLDAIKIRMAQLKYPYPPSMIRRIGGGGAIGCVVGIFVGGIIGGL